MSNDVSITTTYGMVTVPGHESQSIPVSFVFSREDPAAVALITDGTRWVFARDLLDGKVPHDQQGDVHVGRSGALLVVRLFSPDGEALICFDAAPIDEFMARVEAICPARSISYDVDSWLRSLTADLDEGEGRP